MAKDRSANLAPPETVISIIGPGMQVIGECHTDGTIRIEGTVQGVVNAGKAVVVGKDGAVEGDVHTQDAVISGRIAGTLIAESRLELQATCRIDGDVRARRMQLEEGAILNGTIQMGENFLDGPPVGAAAAASLASGAPAAHPTSGSSGRSQGEAPDPEREDERRRDEHPVGAHHNPS